MDSSLFRSFKFAKIHIEITLSDVFWNPELARVLSSCKNVNESHRSHLILQCFCHTFFHFCPYSLVLHGKEQRHLAKFLLWCFMSLEKANGDRIFTQPKGSICSPFNLCQILAILKRFHLRFFFHTTCIQVLLNKHS